MKMHKIYVYGTLMQGKGEKVSVPGKLYDLGWFPGARLPSGDEMVDWPTFTAEIIEVNSSKLKDLDHYEGYYESSPQSSLYIRRPYLDGWIYEYNRQPDDDRLIVGGDWQTYKAERDRPECIRDHYKLPELSEEEEAA